MGFSAYPSETCPGLLFVEGSGDHRRPGRLKACFISSSYPEPSKSDETFHQPMSVKKHGYWHSHAYVPQFHQYGEETSAQRVLSVPSDLSCHIYFLAYCVPFCFFNFSIRCVVIKSFSDIPFLDRSPSTFLHSVVTQYTIPYAFFISSLQTKTKVPRSRHFVATINSTSHTSSVANSTTYRYHLSSQFFKSACGWISSSLYEYCKRPTSLG